MADYLADAFKELDNIEDVEPCYKEERFTVDDDGLEALGELEADNDEIVAKEEEEKADGEEKAEEKPAEETEEFIGKVIIDCNNCHSKIFKDKSEVTVDGEIANADEECPYCFEAEGYTVIGEVEPFEETDEEEEEDFDDDKFKAEAFKRKVNRRMRESRRPVRARRRMSESRRGNTTTRTRLSESFKSEEVYNDLLDRAVLICKDNPKIDHSDAVLEAIDEGLIYYNDILELAASYGVIDYAELVDKMVDDLMGDLMDDLEKKFGKSDRGGFDESAKRRVCEKLNRRVQMSKLVESRRGNTTTRTRLSESTRRTPTTRTAITEARKKRAIAESRKRMAQRRMSESIRRNKKKIVESPTKLKVGDTFENAGETWEIVKELPRDYWLLKGQTRTFQPWVVAWRITDDNSWQQGHYFSAKAEALEYIEKHI